MELEHLLHVLSVDQEVTRIPIIVLRDGERGVNIDLCAVNRSQECANYDVALVLRLPQVVVKNVRCNRWVY